MNDIKLLRYTLIYLNEIELCSWKIPFPIQWYLKVYILSRNLFQKSSQESPFFQLFETKEIDSWDLGVEEKKQFIVFLSDVKGAKNIISSKKEASLLTSKWKKRCYFKGSTGVVARHFIPCTIDPS